jgi:inosine triphosphate pyrophosphatase
MAPSELNFITGNANKLAEVRAILGNTVQLKNQNLDLVEIQGTMEEVSTDKCRRAAELVSLLECWFSFGLKYLMNF